MTISSAQIYLDANATEPLRPESREAVIAALDLVGNPSSVHSFGRTARRALEEARSVFGQGFGRDPDQCVFTSGGTEANALALHAYGAGRRVFIGATEHDAIRRAAPEADIIPVMRDGVLDCAVLREKLAESGPALVCVMAANNETGVLSPLGEVHALCQEFGAHLHVDAVQSAGRLEQRFEGCSVALSGHKMGGPKGAGALLLPDAAAIDAFMPGGGQERGRRGGTQALPAIMGMAAAFTAARGQDWSFIDALRVRIDDAVKHVGARVAGDGAARLPNTSNVILDGIGAQIQLMTLDLAGFAVSAGSACSSGKVAASHVLTAMGEQDGATQALRVSLPWNVQSAQVDGFIVAYEQMVQRLRKA
ncbi:cysteine desulfurase family protein [Neokomagataea anthophila]|uniref:Cysteine desulfurase n=1 Tax=Neokomagataea anthophila TaxID=2826925 RepID=A0ABS5E401_9PROT|nr:aminotransferase class V-fold PLP-dependent enzyme [Neokomagataea anthophila]MBR0558556.1 aminotransferase class V-fold PLP-dependent enzyme [Neokomagataea anthophila]